MSPLVRSLRGLVLVYRHGISPLIGPRCRFEPTCSAYALEALQTHGAWRGGRLVIWRLLRCQPFGTPGYDPVPDPCAAHRRGGHQTRTPAADLSGPRPTAADLPGFRPTEGARAC